MTIESSPGNLSNLQEGFRSELVLKNAFFSFFFFENLARERIILFNSKFAIFFSRQDHRAMFLS